FVVLCCHAYHCVLHSFPTRRSSDLSALGACLKSLLCAAACTVPASNSDKKSSKNSLFSLRLAMDSLLLGYRRYRGTWPDLPLIQDRKSTRLNSSHVKISYAVFCLKK